MNINTSLPNFKKKHKNNKNQIIFYKTECKNNKIIENIINNFLIKKNSFIFESVEKRRIRGRYTIIGANPDKIWEFNKKKIHIIENNKKRIIKNSPYSFLKRLIEGFNFPFLVGCHSLAIFGDFFKRLFSFVTFLFVQNGQPVGLFFFDLFAIDAKYS